MSGKNDSIRRSLLPWIGCNYSPLTNHFIRLFYVNHCGFPYFPRVTADPRVTRPRDTLHLRGTPALLPPVTRHPRGIPRRVIRLPLGIPLKDTLLRLSREA
ncbi:hypothetical protein CLOP_g13222 [Closterium sp. NIES-67]|nr:hypothetical protein CLOP_g13222 [Closterium sp. NIES-67]